MQIQTLSLVVPTAGCVNRCKFCVSRMRSDDYPDQIEKNKRFIDLYERDYRERMLFARDNGCNTIILTGDGEPLQNEDFLIRFSHWNEMMGGQRFRWIELQTSGFKIGDEILRFLRNTVRVSTIALSVADLFDNANNAGIVGMPEKYRVDIPFVCSEIRRYDFNLRISLNLVNLYDRMEPQILFDRVRELGANQVIFRVLYQSGDFIEINRWISENRASDETVERIKAHIRERGKALEQLPFGAVRYSVDGISTVLDEDCMPQEVTSSFRYLILRPNCKLYSRWDDEGSLVF